MREGNSRKDLTGLFTSYTANDPQFLITIDREKAKSLHVPLQQITDTLGVYMGSAYVNDFDFNNRSYRVYVQADQQFRAQPSDIGQYYVRSDSGAMIPLDEPDYDRPRPLRRRSSATTICSARRKSTDRRRRGSVPARPSPPWSR